MVPLYEAYADPASADVRKQDAVHPDGDLKSRPDAERRTLRDGEHYLPDGGRMRFGDEKHRLLADERCLNYGLDAERPNVVVFYPFNGIDYSILFQIRNLAGDFLGKGSNFHCTFITFALFSY